MYPKYHAFFGLILSIILFLIFPDYIGLLGTGIIFFSSFLIDVDHYIYFVIKDKSLSLKKAFNYFSNARNKMLKFPFEKRKEYYSGFCFFHGIEWLIILLISGIFISKYFLFIGIGFLLHLCLDWIEESHNSPRMDKISVIYDFFKFKKLKRLV
jgi:hypothetical protein